MCGCWVNMYIFIVRGTITWVWGVWIRLLKAQRSNSKTQDTVALGWGWMTHCLTVTWLLRTQWLLNLRAVEAWTPAPPPSQKRLDTFHLVSLCGTQRGTEKKREVQRRKESIWETSPRLSVQGQGSKVGTEGVCQVLSGADKAMEGLLNVYLATCGQVGTQSTFSTRLSKQDADQETYMMKDNGIILELIWGRKEKIKYVTCNSDREKVQISKGEWRGQVLTQFHMQQLKTNLKVLLKTGHDKENLHALLRRVRRNIILKTLLTKHIGIYCVNSKNQ